MRLSHRKQNASEPLGVSLRCLESAMYRRLRRLTPCGSDKAIRYDVIVMTSITSTTSTMRSIVRITGTQSQHTDDQLAIEEPLEIRIGAEPLATTMRTPGHDAELAAGFCLTEGIIELADDIESIEPCRVAEYGNVVTVTLTDEAMAARKEQIASTRRELYMSSSCGICGKQSIDRIQRKLTPITSALIITPALLAALPQRMRQAQPTFDTTGGLHACALFTSDGELRILREDVGRHNAMDKLIGSALLTALLPLSQSILLVSGRASFELIQKAAVAGVPILAAVGAPSSLAVDLAQEAGMTLIGFLREERMNIYTHAQRVKA